MLVLTVSHNPADYPKSASIHSRRGATMMEYLLVLSLIGVACMVGIGYFGSETNNLTQSASTAINKSLTAAPGTNVLPPSGIIPSGLDDGDTKDTKDKSKDKDSTKDKTK